MNFKIKKIILWPKSTQQNKREINFELDKINVLVGDSQTGKSAIIPIIDYCLGSGKCSIPIGPIRDKTAWFGILIEVNGIFMLIARREPGIQQQSGYMYFDEGKKIVIPDRIEEKNRTPEQVIDRLNQLDNLPRLDFAIDDTELKPYEGRPSIKDFLAFCFQPQHIIANPYTLFYKADTVEHRYKLRTIFPLALNAINNESLELRKKIQRLEEELRNKKRELETREKAQKVWEVELKTQYLQAIELGVLSNVPFPDDHWKFETYISYLQNAPKNIDKVTFPSIDIGSNNELVKRIEKLKRFEKNLVNDLDNRKIKLEVIRSFNVASSSLFVSLNNQSERLEFTNNGWLNEKLNNLEICPICGSNHGAAKEEILNIIENSKEISAKSRQLTDSISILDKEIAEIEKQISYFENELNKIRYLINNLSKENERLTKLKSDIENAYRLVGRIEQALQNYDETRIDSKLTEDILDLENQIERLSKRAGQNTIRQKIDNALKNIGVSIVNKKESLLVENPTNYTVIDIRELTLKILSPSGREDYLFEIGSGSNWLGYHIATILSLHEYFLRCKQNYTPTFIVLDQPSQAFFPETLKDDEEKQLDSDDLHRVKAIFQTLSDFLKETNENIQIIVLEHAGEKVWKEIPYTSLVEPRWHSSNALIPNSWLQE